MTIDEKIAADDEEPRAVTNPVRGSSEPDRSSPTPATPTLDPELLREAHAVRAALGAAHAGASADELLLLELVTDELPVLRVLRDAERQLAVRVPFLLDDPKLARAVLAVARDVRASINAIATRMANGLAAAANLRAQRHLLRSQRARDD